jgi:hypothetical protein
MRHELARILPPGTNVRALLRRMTDAEMIDSYIRCSCCNELSVPIEVAYRLCRQATDAGHWLELLAETQRAHESSEVAS